MPKRSATLVTLVAVILAITVPTLLAIYMARREAVEGEKSRAMAYAREVLHRSDTTAEQIDNGIKILAAEAQRSGPCSDASLSLMRRIDVASSYIQAIGHVSGTQLTCSSIGRESFGLELGPPDLLHPGGVKLRTHVQLPFAAGTDFIVVERDGFAAVIHKALPIDIANVEPDFSIAVLSSVNGAVLTARGSLDPAWLQRLGKAKAVSFLDGDHVVAVAASQRFETTAVAALPLTRLRERTRSAILVLAPVGIAAGLLLAFIVTRLMRSQQAMPAILRNALKRQEFFMLYQPIVDLRDGRIVGAEALIRWQRPNGETIRPDLFIPVAEESGLIQRITARVCELIANDAAGLFKRYPDFHLSINLSPADMHSPETLGLLRKLAAETSAGPGNLIVEATERGFIRNDIAQEITRQMRVEGFCVAIDDFGTGYSSLSYLETFKLDYLKIDKSFVDTLGTDAATSHVVPHIVGMAKSLQLQMVAEGVESESQARYLREQGVQLAQGWLFGRPQPISDLLLLLQGREQGNSAGDLPGTQP
ncbi:EAL domain-containing protein [Niveibacterium sp. SC-1]|uniref:EAL domain-containing protein n=1 Tax=Niveibacterium sp. SC-1 TaxID=3135646 RepID=UPI00311EC18B